MPFSILVVEDDDPTLTQLVRRLEEQLPGSEIVGARSVDEGVRVVDEWLKVGRRFDLAILDFKLPKVVGGIDEINEVLCHELSLQMPETVVSHITSFAHDPRVIEHIARHHTGRRLGFFLDKKAPTYRKEFIVRTREALYGNDIERKIGELFTESGVLDVESRRARTNSPRLAGSATAITMQLCLEIAHTWNFLSEPTKSFVRRYFSVLIDASGRISVVKR